MKKVICMMMSWLLLFTMVTVNLSFGATAEIEDYLKSLEIGSPFKYQNLTVVPVYASNAKNKNNYVTLDEAVSRGYLAITELDGGRVPQVRLSNHSGQYILLVAGEILTGCRQDRLVGRDALIGPYSKNVILPVYCSEQGRWTSKGDHFATEQSQATPALRGMIYSKSSQSEIWEGISKHQRSLSVSSETQALQDIYKDNHVAGRIQNYVEKLERFPRLDEDAVGIIVGLGDRIVAVDLFANPRVFRNLWPKMLKSYAALAICEDYRGGTLTQKQAKDLINEVYRVRFTRQSGLDLGYELQTSTWGMVCSVLAYRNDVVHMGIFPSDREFSRPIQHSDGRIPAID